MKDSDKATLNQAVKSAVGCIIDYIDNDVESLVQTPAMQHFPKSLAFRACVLTPIAFADFEAGRGSESSPFSEDACYHVAFAYADVFLREVGSAPFSRIAGESKAMQQHLERLRKI